MIEGDLDSRRALPPSPPFETLRRKRTFEDLPADGVVIADPFGLRGSAADDSPSTITLHARMSDSNLTSNPAGRELAERAIFFEDDEFILNFDPVSTVREMMHSSLQVVYNTTMLGEAYLKAVDRAQKYKDKYHKARKDCRSAIAQREATLKETREERQAKSEKVLAGLQKKNAELEESLRAAQAEVTKLINQGSMALLKSLDAYLMQRVEDNPHADPSAVSSDRVPPSYLEAHYEPFVPPRNDLDTEHYTTGEIREISMKGAEQMDA